MAAMAESEIMQQAYSLYEGDTTDWASTDEEYLAARRYTKAAVQMWEFYDNTKWNELFTTLTAASDGTKTITAGTFSYACPTDFRFPCSYVRTVQNSISSYYNVYKPDQIPILDDSTGKWTYFIGSQKATYSLKFNPDLTLTTGDTINYEYYKTATYLTATTSTTEMSNPFFIVHYILYRMYKNDGEDGKAREEFQIAQQLLEQMRVDNMEGLWNTPFNIEENSSIAGGF